MRGPGRVLALALALTSALAAAASAAESALTDAQAKKLFNVRSCNACHEVEEPRIGPPYRAVALRYRQGAPDTLDWLATKIRHGGAGSWGNVPMISNPAVSRDEARAMARWILDLARSGEER
jgi:cytochrome c